MAGEDMRAGDADRQVVADRLKSALDEGRLDLHEYDERLQAVYAAKTFGELDGLTTDLPGTIPAQRAQLAPHEPTAVPVVPTGKGKAAEVPWLGGYAGVVLICVVIWAMSSLGSGEWQYFWPGWMLIPFIWATVAHFRGRKG
ncbi:DUF1707 domain-containing protein [Actinoplanes sp. NPDC051859]|uniref:DUF1707 domain-containing protein n=1 Tax=Actinoplanes sp. NPDC051859 TaxID=3363909 RepID=UPI0037A2D509